MAEKPTSSVSELSTPQPKRHKTLMAVEPTSSASTTKQIKEVEKKIEQVERKIEGFDKDIEKVERKIEDHDTKHLRDKWSKLWDEKLKLRDEKLKLMDEKLKLMDASSQQVITESGISQGVEHDLETIMKFYVDRHFAKFESIAEALKQSRQRYFFLGPSGSDNAQCLNSRRDLVKGLTAAKSLCFTFSPNLATGQGSSTFNCGFKYTDMVYFQPFSEEELDKYVKLRSAAGSKVPEKVITESKKMNMLLPQLFDQCSSGEHVERWVHAQVQFLLQKHCSRLRNKDEEKTLTGILMKACSGLPLKKSEEECALQSGLFYSNTDSIVKMAYPSWIVQEHLYQLVRECYDVIRADNLGGAIEFLVISQLQLQPNLVECIGTKCSALHSKLDIVSKNPREQVYTIKVTNVVIQCELTDVLPTGAGCHLIKLKEGHYAIDFIIIERSAGEMDAEKLFFVQVFTTRYQQHTGPKLPEVYRVSETLMLNGNAKSPLEFYSEQTKIGDDHCYFVYACTEVPKDSNKTVEAKLYFFKIII